MSGKIIREYGGIIKKRERAGEGEQERENRRGRGGWAVRERKWQEDRKRRARVRGEEGGWERWNAGVSEETAERGGGRGWDAESGKESDDEERGVHVARRVLTEAMCVIATEITNTVTSPAGWGVKERIVRQPMVQKNTIPNRLEPNEDSLHPHVDFIVLFSIIVVILFT